MQQQILEKVWQGQESQHKQHKPCSRYSISDKHKPNLKMKKVWRDTLHYEQKHVCEDQMLHPVISLTLETMKIAEVAFKAEKIFLV